MGNLFSALGTAGESLKAFETGLSVTQNNVTNANTPGYADQVPVFDSLSFQPQNGLLGGVQEQTHDTSNQFAETAVQQQTSLLGQYQQLQTSLAPLQSVFDVSANSPIPSALNNLFQSFSNWSANPGDPTARGAVLSAASQVSAAFQQSASQLDSIRTSTDGDIQSTVAQINQDAALIQGYNAAIGNQTAPDAGLKAQLTSTLDNLSNLANVQVIPGNGNTVTVLLGGQTPLVIGTQVNALKVQAQNTTGAPNPGGAPNTQIVDSSGNDVTSQITSGGLAGLLSVRNNLLPSLAGGANQTGELNVLAKGLADAVNTLQTQGSTTSTPPYQAGAPLFTYDATSATDSAATLAVNPSITASQLAPVETGPPLVSNGNALNLAGLASTSQINGQNFTQYFGSMVATVGNAAATANTQATAQQSMLAQAQNLRQQLSGVSLDEEAIRLVQMQRAYQAASRIVSVVDQLAQSLLDIQ
ncbi:MAG TPA: flagellar hook-associated protein FlgK [Bryobacteraceae bacterium]|nr:flagellar hook-associated protein FlgK [Bryobacteraceae bacterium]